MSSTRQCRRHRSALAALADRATAGPTDRDALDHVERCPDCAAALGELMLTVVALRRIGQEAAARGAVPDDAWARLRSRIEQSSRAAREQAWRWRATLGGLATASLLVAAVVGPSMINVHAGGSEGIEPGYNTLAFDRMEWQVELANVTTARRTGGSSDSTELSGTTFTWAGPRWQPAGEEGGVFKTSENGASRSRFTGFRPI